MTLNEHAAHTQTHTQTHTSCVCTGRAVCEYCENGLVISYACHLLLFMCMCPSGTECETDGGGVDEERKKREP